MDMEISIETAYKGAVTGEQKADEADRLLAVIKMPDAPRMQSGGGEVLTGPDLMSHSLSLGVSGVSYSLKPKERVFERLAAETIERSGGVVAFNELGAGALTKMVMRLALSLARPNEEQLKEMAARAARRHALRLAQLYVKELAMFFNQKLNVNPKLSSSAEGPAERGAEPGGRAGGPGR